MTEYQHDSASFGGQLRSVTELQELLYANFPFFLDNDNDENLIYAFGYGSGVLSQNRLQTSSSAEANDQNDNDKKMIDMILVVKDALGFHQQNLVQNPDHYPFWARRVNTLRLFLYSPSWFSYKGSSYDAYLRDPGVYFNVTPQLKYGIVQFDALVDDLEQWKYLYVAGRLHKPVVEITCHTGEEGQRLKHVHQQQQNLPAALAAALLFDFHQKIKQQQLRPPSEVRNTIDIHDRTTMASDVYMQIAGLSYAGDPRVGIAEDPQKTQHLVHAPGQMERFDSLYRPSIQALERAGILSVHATGGRWAWDWNNPKAHRYLWSQLPRSVQTGHDWGSSNNNTTANANTISVKEDLNRDALCAASMALHSRLVAIVAPAARCQAIKGVFTAGIMKSTQYALRKLSKGIFGRIKKK
jgi:translocator assembly and maintenance protein 41